MTARQEADIGVNVDFSVRKGHTLGDFLVTWTDSNDVAIDMMGHTLTSVIVGSEDVFDLTITEPDNGIFTIGLSSTTTANFTAESSYDYLISVDTGDGIYPLFYGKLFIERGLI